MQIAKFRDSGGHVRLGRVDFDNVIPLDLSSGQFRSLFEILETEDPYGTISFLAADQTPIPLSEVVLLPPIDDQEVWAAGVTYKRSKAARMEESEASADCYDRVYVSPRPELFFKASPHRVAGHGEPLRIRADADWNVPEPELTLVLTSQMRLIGFTIGNDMSSRDIEGENPLYLPQAKVYNQCCGLGPWITLVESMPEVREEVKIKLTIRRDGAEVFTGATDVSHMARSFENLVSWLARDNSFPKGAFLLTGTGVVPNSGFTLFPGDEVQIDITGIGTLVNPIVQG